LGFFVTLVHRLEGSAKRPAFFCSSPRVLWVQMFGEESGAFLVDPGTQGAPSLDEAAAQNIFNFKNPRKKDTSSEAATEVGSTLAPSTVASSSVDPATITSFQDNEAMQTSYLQSPEAPPEAPPLPRWWSPESPEAIVELSRGSRQHDTEQCIPCKFFRSLRGCRDGRSCNLCHHPHAELTRSAVRRMVRRSGLKKRATEDAQSEEML